MALEKTRKNCHISQIKLYPTPSHRFRRWNKKDRPAVSKLSPVLKAAHTDVPWNLVSGFRHRLVHDYEDINWSIIIEVIFDDMPRFISQIRQICKESEQDKEQKQE